MNGSEPPSSSTTFLRLRPATSATAAPARCGAGQRHAGDPVVGDDGGGLLVGGVDVDIGAFGEAGVVEDLLDRRSRLGTLRCVLQQHRVADAQIWPREPRHLVVGEVPRHDPQQDAERRPPDHRVALSVEQRDRLVGQQILGVVGVVLVDRGAELDLADGVLDRLAHLADDDLGELALALGVQLRDPSDQRGPFGDGRRARPAHRSRRGGCDGGLNLGVGGGRVFLDDLTGRRVGHCIIGHARRPHLVRGSVRRDYGKGWPGRNERVATTERAARHCLRMHSSVSGHRGLVARDVHPDRRYTVVANSRYFRARCPDRPVADRRPQGLGRRSPARGTATQTPLTAERSGLASQRRGVSIGGFERRSVCRGGTTRASSSFQSTDAPRSRLPGDRPASGPAARTPNRRLLSAVARSQPVART